MDPSDARLQPPDVEILDSADAALMNESARELGAAAACQRRPFDEVLDQLAATYGGVAQTDSALIAAALDGYRATDAEPIRRQRSVEQLTSDVLRLIAVHQIRWAEAGAFDLDRMLDSVMQAVADAAGCDGCSLFLFDPFRQTLMLRATVGLNPHAVGRVVIRSDVGITGLAASSREPQVAPVASEHPAFLYDPQVGEDAFTSQLSVPIVLEDQDRLIGVMNLQTVERHDFTADEIAFIEDSARDLAIAIQSARVHSQNDAQLAERIRELNRLQTVTRAMASTRNPKELVSLVASSAAELIGGASAIVFRVRKDGLVIPVSRYPTSTGDAALGGHALDIATTVSHSPIARSIQPDPNIASILYCAPLVTAHGVIGAIVVVGERIVVPNDDHLSMLQAFADSATLALENTDLYDEARRGYETASTLLQEMHHRVRNNLQIVASLLSMQARAGADAGWDQPLSEAVARVQSIASIHDLLSQQDVTSTTVAAVARTVIKDASITTVAPGQQVEFNVTGDDVEVPSRQAMILALLINECLTNSIYHGFNHERNGTIDIRISRDRGWVEVAIEDDGIGLPASDKPRPRSGLGTRIASTLAESDLKGSFRLEPREPHGTRAILRFPLAEQ